MKKNQFYTLSLCFLLMFSMIFLNSCRPDPSEDIVVGESKDEFDMEDQVVIGDAITEAIKNPIYGFDVLDRADFQGVYNHLNSLLGQVVNTATVQRRTDFNWNITILKDDEQVNAFVAPGGHLFIYTGMLKYLEGEHELVGVIAHEVAYADSDMLINRMREEFGSKKLSKILSNDQERENIILQMSEDLRDVVYSREDIEQADDFCTEIICEFLWDGKGLLSVLQRGSNLSRPIDWLQSKPADDHRNFRLQAKIQARGGDCGMPDSTFQERYLDTVVKRLP